MPEFYAIGISIQSGQQVFANERTKTIIFEKPFAGIPAVDLTLDAAHLSPPYRVNVTPTGFIIRFQIGYTGTVEWKAVKK